MKALLAILIAGCAILAVALWLKHDRSEKQIKVDRDQILVLSNEWVQTRSKLADQETVNVTLQTNLDTHVEQITQLSNKLVDVSATLTKVETDAKAAAKVAEAEMAKRDARITELETERDSLTQKMVTLNTSITSLETQISETEKKLAASEGDRDFLLKELKRLQAEKAELERQFNDLAVLREQVKKLKEELSISRRLEWIRRGLYGEQKGGQRLQAGLPVPAARTNYPLDVEIHREGGARVVPAVTNAPATNSPSVVNPPPAGTPK